MAFGESWHIKSRAHQCAVTGNNFADGETIIAAIFPDPESSGWIRKDYSLEGWEQRDTSDGEKFSQWKTIYKAPVAIERVEVTKESPIDLLRRMVDEDEEHTEKVRFILAVMLERQKILVEKDTQAVPSGILRVYEHRKEGDVFLIRDPNVALDQVEAMQQEVLELLENHGRKPQASEPIAEEAPGSEREMVNDLDSDTAPVEETVSNENQSGGSISPEN
ncbi:MAG: hypothetical protein RLZZ553_905 [Verrucomicrobiota bacterium]|jgi:hypothetical protein